MASAHQASPAANTAEPSVTTTAAPNLAISRPATANENSGTMSGPGAMASPARSADQPQSFCAHSTADSSMAPNDAENSRTTVDAPVNGRLRNNPGSMSGL